MVEFEKLIKADLNSMSDAEIIEFLQLHIKPDGTPEEPQPELPHFIGQPEKCPVCGGCGFVDVGELHDGYTFVRRCECWGKVKGEARLERSGLSNAINEQTFQTFRADEPWQQKMVSVCTAYTNKLLLAQPDEKLPWLYVSGQPGCGKTHICTAVCGRLMADGMDVLYVHWVEKSRELKAHVNEQDFETLMQPLVAAQVLYLDDLAKPIEGGKPTEADLRILFDVINRRYVRSIPTIISSEVSLQGMLELDRAIGSRIFEKAREYQLHIGLDKAKNWRLHHP